MSSGSPISSGTNSRLRIGTDAKSTSNVKRLGTTENSLSLLYRLIDAGCTGLSDLLLDEGFHKASIIIKQKPTSRLQSLHHISLDLKPVPLYQTLLNIFVAGHYISDPYSVSSFNISSTAGPDIFTLLVQFFIFNRVFQFLTCGRFPRYKRVYNSFVRWNEEKRCLYGTDGKGGEFGYLTRINIYQAIIGLSLFIGLMLLVFTINPKIPGFQPNYNFFVIITDTNDSLSVSMILNVYYAVFLAGLITVVGFITLEINSCSLIGSRKGSLPVLLSHVLQSKVSEFMISYAWADRAKHTKLARGLAAILPDCWIDVRSLVSGQEVTIETMRAAAHVRVLVILLSPDYLRSRNCAGELFATIMHRHMITARNGQVPYHVTHVLIEEKYFKEIPTAGSTNKMEVKKATEYLTTLGYSVTNLQPEADWLAIKQILSDAGCQVHTTIDSLLQALDTHATRADTPEDKATCFEWWKRYGVGRINTLHYDTHENNYRVPWNVISNGRTNRANRTQSMGLWERSWRCMCRRRPASFRYPFNATSISTGIGGKFIDFEGKLPPQPHVDATPKCLMFTILFPVVLMCFAVLWIGWYTLSPPGSSVTQSNWALGEICWQIGWGVLGSAIALLLTIIGEVRYANELTAPQFLLHSHILFPLFAFCDIQDIQNDLLEETEVNFLSKDLQPTNALNNHNGNHATIANAIIPNESPFSGSILSSYNPETLSIYPTVTTNTNNNESNTTVINPMYQNLRVNTNIHSPSNTLQRLPTMVTRSYSEGGSTTNTLPRWNKGFKILFCCPDNSDLHPCLGNINKFLNEAVFGLDESDKDRYLPVVDIMEIFRSPAHPQSMVIYVFVLDNEHVRNAWRNSMMEKTWRHEQVILVTNTQFFGTGPDLSSAEQILKTMLSPSNTENTLADAAVRSSLSERSIPVSAAVACDLLRAFETLDNGEPFIINPISIPSSSRARETLTQILRRLNYDRILYKNEEAYVCPRDKYNNRPLFVLKRTLGPILKYGASDIRSKQVTIVGHKTAKMVPSEDSTDSTVSVSIAQNPLSTIETTRSSGTIIDLSSGINDKRIRLQDYMLIVYDIKPDDQTKTIRMPTGSPYLGIVPAILEAISVKLAPVLMLRDDKVDSDDDDQDIFSLTN